MVGSKDNAPKVSKDIVNVLLYAKLIHKLVVFGDFWGLLKVVGDCWWLLDSCWWLLDGCWEVFKGCWLIVGRWCLVVAGWLGLLVDSRIVAGYVLSGC